MPLPTPNKGEKEQDFVSRCAGHKTMNKDFPDRSQRVAVCYSQWKKHKMSDEEADAELAVWSTAYINNLPDSSFAYISPGGSKDGEGKTTPRSLRHLPYKDADGKIDLPHLRNALARLPQTNISPEAKAKAKSKLMAAAKSAGVEVEDD